jgi:hypothetical protein
MAANRVKLPEQGTVYPDVVVRGARLQTPDHNMVGRAAAGRTGWFGLSLEQYIDQFETIRKRACADRVILSGETFLGAAQPWDYETENSYRAAAQHVVDRLAAVLSDHEVQVVVYLRRQDHWLESAINQTIKFGGLMPPRIAGADIDTLIDVYRPRLDYEQSLRPWREAFGRGSVSIGVYEDLAGDALIADFCRRAGLDRLHLEVPSWDPNSRNTGLNRDVLEFKRILNRVPRPRYEERMTAETLRWISADMEAERDGPTYPLLDAARRLALLEDAEPGNRTIASDWLGFQGGQLFAEPWPDPDEDDAYPGLSPERGTEILLRYERARYSLSGRVRVQRHRLAELLRKRLPWLHSAARILRNIAR